MNLSIDEYKNIIKKEKKPKKLNDFEHKLQVACVNWFRLVYPNRTIFAIPNGGSRNKVEAAKLKAEGVLKGVSDLFIPEPSGKYHGMYAETKYGKNGTSVDQDIFIEKMTKNGYYCIVYWDIDTFVEEVKNYLKG